MDKKKIKKRRFPHFTTHDSSSSSLFDEVILKSWWAILFFLLCFFVYDQAVKRREREEELLSQKLHQLVLSKKTALEKQEELRIELDSQSDESWIELILMQKLGLVPEGQTKIHFKTSLCDKP